MNLRTEITVWVSVFCILGSTFIGIGTNAFIGLGVFCCFTALDGLLRLTK